MIFGIMGAMPDEVDQLCAKLENVTVEPYGGVEYHKGTLAGKQVVVCCAGMGKANAASHHAGAHHQVRRGEDHLLRHCRQHDQQDRHRRCRSSAKRCCTMTPSWI